MPRPQTAGEAPYGTSPVTSCGQPRSFPGADVFQRPFELRVYAAAHLGLDLGGLKHLDMGDDAYALVYLAAGSFITAVEPYTLTTEFSQAPLYANL